MARKMKDSGIEWIGEIPEGWGMCLYKYCCSVQPGYPFDSAKFSNFSTDGFPIIRIRDITSGEIHTYYTGEYSPNYIVTAGDLLVGMDGDFNVRWWNNDDALLNQRCCRVTEKDSVLRRFLYYVLPFTLQHINTLTYATTVKHLANGDILNSFIAFPSLPAQQNIVHYLDTVCSKIDSMLSKTRSSIEEYKKLKQAVITQAVATQQCSHIKLKYLMNVIVDCPHETPTYSFTGNYYVIRTADQALASLRRDEDMYRLDASEYKKRTRRLTLDKDDIVYGREGERWGLACIVPESNKYCLGQRIMQFRCNTKFLYPKYAMYALNSESVYQQGVADTIGSTSPHVNISTICNYLLPVPALTEQKEIANYLDAKCAEIDRLIAKKEQLVKELESYKKSLIYEVVTGKREV